MSLRRMFSKSITNSSKFLMMPHTTQLLYFQLGMNADDEGFIESLMVLRMDNFNEQDLNVLQINNFIILHENLVVEIIDWKENNYIRADRLQESSIKTKVLKSVELKKGLTNGFNTECQSDVSQVPVTCTPQDRLGKDRIGYKEKINKKENGSKKMEEVLKEINSQLTDEIMQEKIADHFEISLESVKRKKESLVDYVLQSTKNYTKYTDYVVTLRNWIRRDIEQIKLKQTMQSANTRGGVIDATS